MKKFEEMKATETMETNGGTVVCPIPLGPIIIAQYVVPWIISHIN